MSQSSSQTSYLTTEINTWKNKFIELNREFHTTQEAYMLCQAELENMKKGGMKVEKITTELRSVDQISLMFCLVHSEADVTAQLQ